MTSPTNITRLIASVALGLGHFAGAGVTSLRNHQVEDKLKHMLATPKAGRELEDSITATAVLLQLLLNKRKARGQIVKMENRPKGGGAPVVDEATAKANREAKEKLALEKAKADKERKEKADIKRLEDGVAAEIKAAEQRARARAEEDEKLLRESKQRADKLAALKASQAGGEAPVEKAPTSTITKGGARAALRAVLDVDDEPRKAYLTADVTAMRTLLKDLGDGDLRATNEGASLVDQLEALTAKVGDRSKDTGDVVRQERDEAQKAEALKEAAPAAPKKTVVFIGSPDVLDEDMGEIEQAEAYNEELAQKEKAALEAEEAEKSAEIAASAGEDLAEQERLAFEAEQDAEDVDSLGDNEEGGEEGEGGDGEGDGAAGVDDGAGVGLSEVDIYAQLG